MLEACFSNSRPRPILALMFKPISRAKTYSCTIAPASPLRCVDGRRSISNFQIFFTLKIAVNRVMTDFIFEGVFESIEKLRANTNIRVCAARAKTNSLAYSGQITV